MAQKFGEFGDAPRGGHGREAEVGHASVLLQQAIDFLAIQRGGTYLDVTVGLGGHSLEIARRLGAAGHLIGVDKDPQALEIAHTRLAPAGKQWPEVRLEQGSFAGIDRLYGSGAVARLSRARVAVVGLGGVGSWAVEALARSAVGHLTLVDADDLCLSNTSRQIGRASCRERV